MNLWRTCYYGALVIMAHPLLHKYTGDIFRTPVVTYQLKKISIAEKIAIFNFKRSLMNKRTVGRG